jgi:acetyl-CoA decarbonylase/synthase complex subunit delta
MEDMSTFAQQAEDQSEASEPAATPEAQAAETPSPAAAAPAETPTGSNGHPAVDLDALKEDLKKQLMAELRETMTRQIAQEIIASLSERFLGTKVEPSPQPVPAAPMAESKPKTEVPTARQRIATLKSVPIRKEPGEVTIQTVTLGATRDQGGTRGRTCTIGGAKVMPFHHFEGQMPHRPVVAMEVFDLVSPKYPAVLKRIYGDVLADPAKMAKLCVEQYGADLISVRLEGTHPEKGNRSPEQALEIVQSVLAAVDVPLIVTGHNHYERNNEVMKLIAQKCAGERLLLNWVETDNYRTIAGAALAYGHCVVTQSPIDVNMAKQLNILLGNMDVKGDQIIMDPMTGALGYGIEYTYSVMERIRLTALGGDKMLASPMIVSPGQECAKVKELRATEAEMPAWGDLEKRAALWELATATNLLYAGADVLIMYHPQAAMALRRTIDKLMDAQA